MSIAPLLRNEKPRSLTAEEEKLKRDLYEKIPARRRKFIDPYLNTDQFLWNASITQSLLKNKNLMVKLEAVDLLANRENTYSFHSGVAVGLREYNGFERYAVLHLIYQFK